MSQHFVYKLYQLVKFQIFLVLFIWTLFEQGLSGRRVWKLSW
jgi:hypothetical protein